MLVAAKYRVGGGVTVLCANLLWFDPVMWSPLLRWPRKYNADAVETPFANGVYLSVTPVVCSVVVDDDSCYY